MSSKKQSNGSNAPRTEGTSKSFRPISFINVNLNESHKKGFEHWLTLTPDLFSLLDDVLLGGYKLSVGRDENSNAFTATLTNKSGQPEFVDHCFTLRARDAGTAIARVLWVHAVLCEADWNVIGASAHTGDIW